MLCMGLLSPARCSAGSAQTPGEPGKEPAARGGSEPGQTFPCGQRGIRAPVVDIRPGWRERPRLGGASGSAAVNSAGTASAPPGARQPGPAAPRGCGQSPRSALSGQRLRDRPGRADRGEPRGAAVPPALRSGPGPGDGPGRGAAAGRVVEQRSAAASGRYRSLRAPSSRRPRRRCRRPSLAGPLPDVPPHLAPCRPGSDTRLAGRGAALRLGSSAALHSLVTRDGGQLVFADRSHGPPITLRARYILIHDGGELHIGSERCPFGSRATISLYGRAAEGAAVEGFGQKFVGVGRGGILELHGRRRRSWTLLDRTLHPGWGSRGPNLRVPGGGTAGLLAGRFDSHLRPGGGRRLSAFLPGSPPAVPLGDSAARSLTPKTRLLLLRDRLGCSFIVRLRYRGAS
ncbi:LOW QUALITY PROTEIN: POLG alternative reading frame [Cyanocitta cristata]